MLPEGLGAFVGGKKSLLSDRQQSLKSQSVSALLMPAVMSLQIEFDSTGASFAAYKTRYPVSGTAQYPLANGRITTNTFGWSSFEFGGVHVFIITPCVNPTCHSFRSLPLCLVPATTNAGTVAANRSISSIAATAACFSARFYA